MPPWLQPKDTIDDAELQKGLRMLNFEGACSQTMGILTGGAFLVAFALILGASNSVIGLLAAVPPAAQLLQIPAIFLVDRIRIRKALMVVAMTFSRLFWFVIAFLPFIAPPGWRIPVFLASLLMYFGLANIAGCAYNSWWRDFVPEEIMGRYLAKRLAIMGVIGAALSLLGGLGVDLYAKHVGQPVGAYTILFTIGGVFGLLAVVFVARTPEPLMPPTSHRGLFSTLAQPFRDANFRQLLKFLGIWNFALMLAAPFFAVYMLKRLELSMTWVLGLSVVSQVFNVLFLKVWGQLADRFTNKSVLAVSGPLFMFSIILWPFTTMPEKHFLTIPLLAAIHALGGMSIAGVTLAASNLALKSAPKGAGTAYLATNAMVSGVMAMIAPILAGLSADWLDTQELTLTLRWASTLGAGSEVVLPAIDLRGLDFIFLAAFLIGIYAIHRQLAVKEEGEVEERVVITELYSQVSRMVRHVSNISGMRALTAFPYGLIKGTIGKLSIL